MNIGLFGGAFDPFHNGHLEICRTAAQSADLDRLIVIPTGNAPHKNGFNVSFEHRFNMTALALEGTPYEISGYEGERDAVSYSADTVEHFQRLYPGDRLFFLIGADSYRDLGKWYQPKRITDAATLVVFPRGGMEVRVNPPAICAKTRKIEVSSTFLREKLRAGEDVHPYMPERVIEYIKEHNLYI